MALRNSAYHVKAIASFKPPQSYVVSIGNLSVGGSGKTPLTEKLTKELLSLYQASKGWQEASQPLPFAILSRGYKGRSTSTGGHLIFRTSRKKDQVLVPSASECGDEPYSLAQHLAGIWFGIGKNRRDLSLSLAKKGVRFFILDDGFQHRRLERDCDIVLLDAEEPFANHYVLPRGPLREPPGSLKRADVIVLYSVKDSEQFLRSCKKIAPFTKAPVIGMAPRVTGMHVLSETLGQKQVPLNQLKGALVGAWCGIARPERFMETVISLGCQIVAEEVLADHGRPSKQQLIDFANRAAAQGACYLLCTEKDAVKWNVHESALPSLPLPLFFLRIELSVVEGAEKWNALVQKMYAKAFL